MALSRRTGARLQASIWPGFVDAMTGLLLVLMFVLTIFMVVQFVLRETISGQESELNTLNLELSELADALGLEQIKTADLSSELGSLRATLQTTRAENTAQTQLIARLETQLTVRSEEITTARAQLRNQQEQLTTLSQERAAQKSALSDAEARLALLAQTLAEAESAAETAQSAEEQARAEAALIKERQNYFEELITQLQNDLDARRDQNAALETALAEQNQTLDAAEKARLAEIAAAQELRRRLENSDTELTALALSLEKQRKDAEELLSLLAAARSAEDDLNAQLASALAAKTLAETAESTAETAFEEREAKLRRQIAELEANLSALNTAARSEEDLRDALAAALADKTNADTAATEALSKAGRQARLLATAQNALQDQKTISTKAQREVALLNQQTRALRSQLGELQAILDDTQARDAAAQVQLQNLGQDLNAALARVAAEERKRRKLEEAENKRLAAEAQDLQKFRSEFFGRLRDLLGGQEGVRIVGDRFAFASEVLFPLGSADLSDAGKTEIAKVAAILRGIAGDIPDGIDWIIRVDGHTDNIPVSGQRAFSDNWELSQARALSVLRYMVSDLGIAPNRLSANGFGEFQPLDAANTPEARAQNRRIELKFTER